jgi:hypothetical protein
MWETIKKDPLIKTIVVILIGVLAFGFAFNIMFGSGNGAMGEDMMEGSYRIVNMSFGLQSLLAFLLQILIVLSVIGLGYGVFMYIKETYKNITILNESNKATEDSNITTCPECKSKLNISWKCCPYCGREKAMKDGQNDSTGNHN